MIGSTGDLYQFTRLKALTLILHETDLDTVAKLLNAVLSNISSNELEQLHLRTPSPYHLQHRSLNSILAASARLNDIDSVLSRPQFDRLRHVKLSLGLPIHKPALPNPATAPFSPSLTDSQAFESHFRRYAVKRLHRKVREELKQINSRGILELEFDVYSDNCKVRITNLTRPTVGLNSHFDHRFASLASPVR